jgi:hypothetical protein
MGTGTTTAPGTRTVQQQQEQLLPPRQDPAPSTVRRGRRQEWPQRDSEVLYDGQGTTTNSDNSYPSPKGDFRVFFSFELSLLTNYFPHQTLTTVPPPYPHPPPRHTTITTPFSLGVFFKKNHWPSKDDGYPLGVFLFYFDYDDRTTPSRRLPLFGGLFYLF